MFFSRRDFTGNNAGSNCHWVGMRQKPGKHCLSQLLPVDSVDVTGSLTLSPPIDACDNSLSLPSNSCLIHSLFDFGIYIIPQVRTILVNDSSFILATYSPNINIDMDWSSRPFFPHLPEPWGPNTWKLPSSSLSIPSVQREHHLE
jgi:hypothetical protein